MRAHLRPDQIEEALRRHGYPVNTEVTGIRYSGDTAVLTVQHAGGFVRLEVPLDVMALAGPPLEEGRKGLFSRPT